jgi:hypothetical protein
LQYHLAYAKGGRAAFLEAQDKANAVASASGAAAPPAQHTASATAAAAAELQQLRARASQLEAELAAHAHYVAPQWLQSLMRDAAVTLDAPTIQLLLAKRVDGEIIRALTKDDLVELGITDFAAKKKVMLLVEAAQSLRDASAGGKRQ